MCWQNSLLRCASVSPRPPGRLSLPDDQAGCHDAVGAVGQICQLMTR